MIRETELHNRRWTVPGANGDVHVVLSERELGAAGVIGGDVAGYGLLMHVVEAGDEIPDDASAGAQTMVVEVQPDNDVSLRRLLKLRADHPRVRTIAAVRDATVPVLRALLHSGISDVISLPLARDELEVALAKVRADIEADSATGHGHGKVISVIRSVGGVGATTVATQAAVLQVPRDTAAGRETCLIDLDLQFGNAATYLGLQPKVTVGDLIEAGARVDAAMLRAAATRTPGGLHVIAAPPDIVPLEAVSTDQILGIIDIATREFGTVFLDFPGSWTNWSLSQVGRSDLVVLVIELTVASLRQARRQLTLLAQQGFEDLPILVVANRTERKLFRSINLRDAEEALNRPVTFGITNDFPLVRMALEQGVPLNDVKSGSRVAKDVIALLAGCDELLDRGP